MAMPWCCKKNVFCFSCIDGKAPQRFQLDIAGQVETGNCNCPDTYNGSFILDYTGPQCYWRYDLPDIEGSCTSFFDLSIGYSPESIQFDLRALGAYRKQYPVTFQTGRLDCLNFDDDDWIPYRTTSDNWCFPGPTSIRLRALS